MGLSGRRQKFDSAAATSPLSRVRSSGRPGARKIFSRNCDGGRLGAALAPQGACDPRTVIGGGVSGDVPECAGVSAGDRPQGCNSQGGLLNTDLVLRSPRSGRLEGRSPGPGIVLRDASPKATLLRTRSMKWPSLGVTPGCDWRRKALKRCESGLRMARAKRPEAAARGASSEGLGPASTGWQPRRRAAASRVRRAATSAWRRTAPGR